MVFIFSVLMACVVYGYEGDMEVKRKEKEKEKGLVRKERRQSIRKNVREVDEEKIQRSKPFLYIWAFG